MPMSESSSRSSATRCSAERPRMPNASRSPRTSFTRLSGVTRPRALPRSDSRTRPVWQGRSPAPSRSATPSSYSASRSPPGTSSSAMPVNPVSTASSARYSCAGRPTEDALTRIGRSLETSVTSWPSARRFSATARIRVSLSPSRKPAGSTAGSLWLSSTRTVPPSSPTGTGESSRPWISRSSSSSRRADRAKYPSSGCARLASSSVITTTGRTTSCSWKRLRAAGSASRTLVSTT
jgi:hypothetical protein